MQICIWKFVGMTHFMAQNKTQMIPTALLTNVQELRTNKNLCKTAMEWHPIEIRLDFSGCQITAINLHNLQFFKKFWIEEKASTINGNKTNKSHDYIFSRFANKTICYSDWRRANALTHSYRAHTHTHFTQCANWQLGSLIEKVIAYIEHKSIFIGSKLISLSKFFPLIFPLLERRSSNI